MKSRTLSVLKFIVGWPLSLLAFIFLIRIIAPQAPKLMTSIQHLNLQLLVYGTLCFILFYFLRGYIWYRLLKGYRYNIPLKQSTTLWATSELKRYIPGNIWSFLGRTVLFNEKGVSKKDMGTLLILEAEIFVVSCIIISMPAVPFIFKYLLHQTPQLVENLIYLLTTLGVCFYIFHKKMQKKLPTKLQPIAAYLLPQLPTKEIFLLLSISSAALILFGLGYYLSILSVAFIHPQMIIQMIGFFVLSFVVGYLSFLTPAGFGVREGILIFGLTKLLSLNTASFVVLFTRVILMIAEVLFIGAAIAIEKIKNPPVIKAEKWISANKQATILICFLLLYCLYFTIISFLRYDNFYTGRFDLGNMAQTVWNTSRGRIFIFTNPNGTDPISRLAFHADFLLILLTPFYYIWANPKMLLLIQTLVVGAGAIFVYLLAKDILKNKNFALIFSLIYLFNPGIQRTNLYDFHPITLATTFLLATFYFYRKKSYLLFGIFALLSAISKEEVWLIIALFGLCIALFQKKKLMGSLITIACIGVFYYLLWYAIPQNLGSQHFALSYYSEFGDAPGGIIKKILLSPQKTFLIITEKSRLIYLTQLLSPLGFLPILAPWLLIFAAPDLLINLLSNNPQLHQLYYQYTACITPFLFIAAIYSVSYLKKYLPKLPNLIIMLYLICACSYTAYQLGPLPGSLDPNIDMMIKPIQNKQLIDAYLNHIPKRLSVAASNNLGSHLSERQNIYTLPLGVDKADVLVFLLTETEAPPSLSSEKQQVQKLKQDTNYKIIVEKGPFIVFRKRARK